MAADFFALLDEPRRPWLDTAALKQRFLGLAAEFHPDRFHQSGTETRRAAQERYAALNAAYQCLREPKDRLRHLLELERGSRPSELQEIPAALMELFLEVGTLCRQIDAFLTEKTAVTSPLLKVQLFERSSGWSEQLAGLRGRINLRQEDLLAELQALDRRWTEAGETPDSKTGAEIRSDVLSRLEELYRLFSYYGRWISQIQERNLRLTL